MKKITLLFILMAVSFGYSQTLPIDFETPTTWADFAGGVVTTVANPQSNADNNSANVGEMVKNTGEVYGGSALTLSSAMDFNANNTFSMKVYSIKAGTKVLLKVENSTNGAIQYEREVTMLTTNAWETLTFDFSAIPNNSYDKIVLIFDLGTSGDGSANFTYLFDDITLFDDGGTATVVALPFDFSNPDQLMIGAECATSLTTDAGNDVLQVIGGGALYDNAQIVFSQNVDLSDPANNTITFRVKAVAPLTSGSHLFKFESAGSGDASVELPFTTTGTDWQTITLDFDDAPGDNPGDYSKMVIFTDFNNNEAGTYLFDDIAGGTNVGPPATPDGPAPTPSTPDASVFRLYGDTGTYNNNMVYDYSFGTLAGEPDLDDTAVENKALKFDFSVAGWGSGQNASTNVSTAQFVHFDYWATNATDFKLFIISKTGANATVETTYEIGTAQPLVSETWTSVSIPIATFTAQGFDVNNYLQYKYDVTSIRPGIVYIDNLYFSDVPPTALSVNNFETSGFKIYPNPSQDEWIVNGSSIIDSIDVYDALGRQVMSLKPSSVSSKITASELPKGMYFASISSNSKIITVKLIKN